MRAIAEIDSLEIKISASAEQANKAIRNLTRSLGALTSSLKFDTSSLEKLGKINGNNFKKLGEGLQSFSNAARSLQGVNGNNFDKLSQGLSKIASIDPSKLEALGKIDGNSFRGLGEGVKALSAGLKDLKGVSTKKFETLATGIERLGAIQVGNMQTVASALTPLADGIRTLSSANFDNRNLQNFINSLTRLSNANVGSLASVDFTTLGNNIKGLATALSSADKVEQNTISMTNAIAKLAGAGANIGTVTTELPRLGTALKDFMNTMSGAPTLASETIAFTQAIGQLASAGSKAETVANSLQHLGDELKRFMQTMASAPNVSANVIQMTQALAQLANTGGGTGRAASSLGNAFNGTSVSAIRLSSNTNILSVSLKGLGSRLNKTLKGVKSFTSQMLAAAGIMGGLYGIIRGGLKAMDIASSLTEVQNVVDTTFGDMSDKVQEFADNSIRQFGMSELSVKQFASRFQAMGTAMGIPTSLIKRSNEFLNSQTNGYVGLSDSMSDVSLNLTKLTADIASFYDVEQAEVAEDLAAIYTGMTVPLRKYGLDLTQATLKEWAMKNGLDANIKSMSQAEKTMLRYQYVLANTTAAQGDFEKTQLTWANQVRILKQSFEQLGSIIGTSLINAFKPLVQTLNSVLIYVIDFAEKVTEALGTIFGWKFESGGTGGIAQDWSDIADTTGEAADNIDKMKKGLRAFDELNNITSPDKSGGGAGAGGAGEGAGGGLVKTDAIWENYKSDIDTLYKLGKYIGDALSDAMERIDWAAIYEKARNFGRGLAEFLNGLISPRLFENIGKTIAGALNTALHFLDSFGYWFDWKNFGDSLAAGLLGFLNNIQWGIALSAAGGWGTGIATALNNFISPETFSATGHAVAMALNTAIRFAFNFGQTFDFTNLGESVAAGINKFFLSFHFGELAEAINAWAKGILDAAIEALNNTDWGMVGNQIGIFLEKIDFAEIGAKLGQALWKAINAGIDLFKGMFDVAPIETTILGTIASIGLLGAAISGIGNIIAGVQTFFAPLMAALNGLYGLLSTITTPIVEMFSLWASGAGTLGESFMAVFGTGGIVTLALVALAAGLGLTYAANEEVRRSFDEAISSIKEGLQPALEFITNTVLPDLNNGWEKLMQILSPLGEFLSGMFVSIWQDMINPALTYVGETVLPKVTSVFQNLWNNALVPLGNFLASVLAPVIQIVSDVLTILWQNVVVPLANAVMNILGKQFEALCDIFNGFVVPIVNDVIKVFQFLWDKVLSPIVDFLWDYFQPVFEDVFKAIGGLIDGLSQAFGGLIDFVAGIFSRDWERAWGGIKDIFKGVFNGVISVVEGALNKIIDGLNFFLGKFNGIVSGVGNIIGISVSIPEISKVELPRLATGGIVYKATFAEIGEAGKEGILPLTNRAAMSQLVNEIMTSAGGGNQYDNGYDNYSEEASLLMSQNQLLRRQNELLEQLVKKEFGISKSDIGKAARDYSIEYFNRTGNPAYQF